MNARTAGDRPELAWLRIDALQVDRRYQRDTGSKRSKKLIAQIAANFRWAMFGAVQVARSPGGKFAIIDGQHRVEAARRAGFEQVPCIVVQADSVNDQALAFLAANRDRVIVNPMALHHALVAAGDSSSGAVQAVADAAGVTLPPYPVPAAQMKPGQTVALGAIAAVLRDHGAAHAELVLRALAAAFEGQAGRLRGPLIRAAALILAPPHEGRRDRLVAVLRALPAADLDYMVLDFRVENEGAIERDCLQSILLDLIYQRRPIVAKVAARVAR